jgi:hypothetical protein
MLVNISKMYPLISLLKCIEVIDFQCQWSSLQITHGATLIELNTILSESCLSSSYSLMPEPYRELFECLFNYPHLQFPFSSKTAYACSLSLNEDFVPAN